MKFYDKDNSNYNYFKIFLTVFLAITDDDAINYSQYWEEFKRITIKEPIKVAIFI